MSLIGAVMILAACVLAAMRMVREETSRLRTLRELSAALARLQAEMNLHLTDLPSLAKSLGGECSDRAGRFFAGLSAKLDKLGEKSFPQLWAENVRELLPELEAEDREAFLRLGQTLGRYELDEQLAAIERCRATLDRSASQLAQCLPERRRLAFGLMSAAGALLCILLI